MKTQAQYVEERGKYCPGCGSDQVEGDNPDFSQGEASLRKFCNDCGRGWLEVYELRGFGLFREAS